LAIEKLMNILHLPDKEFLQQVWLNNPSPIMRRLMDMAWAQFAELEDWHIMVAKDAEDAKEKIGSLEYTIECNNEELDKMQREIDRLESRPVDELLRNLAKEFADNRSDTRRAKHEAQDAKAAMEEMSKKLDMWTVMNKV
jgi:glutamyl-tRNA reductase